MKKLGILLALLGGVLKMVDPYHLNLISDGAAQTPGMGATGIGLVPIAILVASGCGFIGDGRLAGIVLMLVSIYGFFFDGGLLIALPFFGSLMIIGGSGQTSAYRGG